MSTRATIAVLFASLLTSACVVVPVTAEDYDPECRIATHHLALQTVQLSAMYNCEHAGEAHVCAAMVLASAGVFTASAIVSGSIMVVGNVAYWTEERAVCMAKPPTPT